jgi:integrase
MQSLILTHQPIVIPDLQITAKEVFDLMDISINTRNDYKYRIEHFLKFLGENEFNVNSYLHYKRFLEACNSLSVSTKNKYLAAARVFLKELNRQGVLKADITQNIKTFNQSKKHKKDGLNDEDMGLLTETISALPPTPRNDRLKALLSLLALQGLRQVEVVRLDVKDVDLVRGTALVLGKGKDDKEIVSLHPETVRALKAYLKSNKIASGALFTSQSNNQRNQRLTTRAIRLIVKETLNPLGIEKSTHGFRHYFTTKLIKTYKGDLLEVAQYTRHRNLEMLQIYNDSVRKEADLPRYYGAFSGVSF